MLRKLLALRYLFVIVVFFMLVNSIFFIVGGVMESVEGIRMLLTEGIHSESRPGLLLLKALDLFLVSMVSVIFAIGIIRLFGIYDMGTEKLPSWLHINSFKELKFLLWETILVTLVVFTLTNIASANNKPNLDMLILPGVVLLLSISLYVMRKH